MATDYTVNMDDERFQQSTEKYDKIESDIEQTYAGMIGGAENIYQPQIDALDKWEEEQTRLQNERTDLTIQQIEQQKQQAHKDYQKEQSGAYVDWRKQSNQYGTEAEKMASSGLMGTGYSESSQVSMYNTYQNRVAQARESFEQVKMNYNNAINEAKLQNNSALAEIALETLKQQSELIVQGTLYKNDLILQLSDKKLQLQQMRDNDWYKVLDQINTENALAEDARQFNEGLEFEAEQNKLKMEFEAKQAELDRQFKEAQEALNRQHDFKLLEAKTEAEKEAATTEFNRQKQLLAQQLANEKALLKYKYDLENQNNSASFNTGSTGSSGHLNSGKPSSNTYASIHGDTSTKNPAVNTAYYQGAKNADCDKYGTFSNGYQPKGISGHGKLKKSGETIQLATQVVYGVDKGKKQTLVQTVWVAEDGTKWYWEGRKNKYIQIS